MLLSKKLFQTIINSPLTPDTKIYEIKINDYLYKLGDVQIIFVTNLTNSHVSDYNSGSDSNSKTKSNTSSESEPKSEPDDGFNQDDVLVRGDRFY